MIESNVQVTVEHIWAATAQAQHQNNGYFKLENLCLCSPEHNQITPNRNIVVNLLNNTHLITPESIERGKELRNYLKGLMFAILADKKLGDYTTRLVKLASNDELKIALNNIGYIASAPQAVYTMKKKDEQKAKINNATGGYLGSVAQKVTVTAKIVKSHYSQDWSRWYVTAVTSDDKVITYSTTNSRITVVESKVTITGKVKNQYVDRYTEKQTTILNFVKTGIN